MNNYSSSSIKVLKGLEGVKKRPGMYIGNTGDGTGLHRLIFEIVDNSMDEALAGFCNDIVININYDYSVSVKDNGRGIPVDFHFEEKKTAVEVIMTTLHSGGKFDSNVYKISSGLHGVGISVVNALSKCMYICIYREGYTYRQDYINGYSISELLKINKIFIRGTLIRFKPNLVYFKNIYFNYNILDQKFRELSFLNSGIKILLKDNRKKKKENVYFFSGGIKAFIEQLNLKKNTIGSVLYFSGIKNDIYVECAIQWTKSSNENIFCYTNNVRQKDGGSHLSGFKSALTKTFNIYMENYFFLKKNKIFVIGDDFREGVVVVLSVKLSDPKFSSQTKEKLVSFNVKSAVESIISKNLYNYLLEHPSIAKIICNKILETSKAREAAKRAKEIIKKKEFLEFNKLSGRLARCQIKDSSLSELYLVEGDSAGGSAKQARSRVNQAILPLKGKILNVEKASIDKLLSSVEIGLLITALGCGIGEDYNFYKLKYHTIIIMTDADVDGLHIRTLLLTFFYRYMKDLILRGCIYVAQPPLYRIKKKKEIVYFNDIYSLNDYLFFSSLNEFKIYLEKNDQILSEEKLKFIFSLYKELSIIIDKLSLIYPKELLDLLIFFDKLSVEDFFNDLVLLNWKNNLQNYFNNFNHDKNFYFTVDFNKNDYIKISLCKYAIFYDYFFDINFFSSIEYENLFSLGIKLNDFINKNYYIKKGNQVYKIVNFRETMEWIKNESKIGVNIQRYKGLGEMNPEQLWETTMNPKNRSIIKIKLEDEKNVDVVFSMLMGDNIEGRKKFIDTNAIYADNIDI
ncbi:MAG TPA: DNA gyrase subunit B [Candidatus Azosocius sp. HAIN]